MNYRMIAYSVGRILCSCCGNNACTFGIVSLLYGESIAFGVCNTDSNIRINRTLCICKSAENKSLYGRDGMFIVAIGWIVISIIGCLPFYISGQIPRVLWTVFETVSGFTTTGSSILTNVEALDKSLLFGEVLLIGSAVWV